MTAQQAQLDMRDLPELNSVSIGGRGLYVISMMTWFLTSAMLGAIGALAIDFLIGVLAQHWIGSMWCIVLGICITALIGPLLARNKLFNWQWTTNDNGMTIHGLFLTQNIRWAEITEVQGRPHSAGRIYHLWTATSSFAIADMVQTSGELMGASIYQHLRRFGKADESLLTPGARSFWMPIPEGVPDEMDWHHPNPPNWSILMVVTIIIAIAAPLAYFLGYKLKLGFLWTTFQHWGVVVVAWAYKSLRDRLIMARSVTIRHDHIEMRTARRSIYLPWSDIRYVHWDNTHRSMVLGRTMLTDVGVVPYRANDPDSAACILAIIRHLRQAHHVPPVAIPTQLLPILYTGATAPVNAFSGGQAVELKVTNTWVGVVPGLLGFLPLAVFFLLMRNPKRLIEASSWLFSLIGIGPIIGLAVGVIAVFATRRTYSADSGGITMKSLLRRSFVNWRDIASYSGTRTTCVLTDPSGRVLLMIPFASGAPNAEQFFAFLDARLAPVRQQHLPTLTR